MQGTPESPGINMRALKELFQVAVDRESTVQMQVQASILEIYNDSIFDLLTPSPRATADKLEIKEVGCAPLPLFGADQWFFRAGCLTCAPRSHARKRDRWRRASARLSWEHPQMLRSRVRVWQRRRGLSPGFARLSGTATQTRSRTSAQTRTE